MFRTPIFLANIMLLAANLPATAAETDIQPLPALDCNAIAAAVGKSIRIPLTTRVGPALSYPTGLHGNACIISGNTSGLTIEFEQAQDKIAAALTGWKHLDEFDADAPFSTAKGFMKGPQRVFYTLSTDPPRGTCRDNKPIADCRIPHRRWTWKIVAAAFLQ